MKLPENNTEDFRAATSRACSRLTADSQLFVTWYEEYLRCVVGLADETRRRYLAIATRFFIAQCAAGTPDWSRFDGDSVASFVRTESERLKVPGHRAAICATRSVLRFLVFKGLITPELIDAVPRSRRYKHASLPVQLTEHQLVLTFAACRGDGPTALRDRAILLLLSRLGVRAKEIILLRLEDINWIEGTITFRSTKSLRERTLPLTKDVGQSLVQYLQKGRPKSTSRFVFLRRTSPNHEFQTSGAVSYIVHQYLTRAGLNLSRMGAHVFRHTAATDMIRRGVSFKEVADILGHQSIDTTAIYAKVDLTNLASVALPWPGGDK
jgi:site-specific recombinase XerD